jgi:DNA primase
MRSSPTVRACCFFTRHEKSPRRTHVLIESCIAHPPGPVRNGHRVWHPPNTLCPGGNGLSGETRVVTEWGLRPLNALAPGTSVLVLGVDGTWSVATALRTADAPACELILERNRVQHLVRTSATQQWPVTSPARRMHGRDPLLFRSDALTILAMSPIWKLVTVNPMQPRTLDDMSVLHGIVYGDGTYHRQAVHGGRKPFCQICLCNDPNGCDSRRLAPLFEAQGFRPVVREDKGQVRFYGLPPHWKTLPPAHVSPAYVRGFVAGWFAADGHIDPKARVALLSSASRESLEWLQSAAPRAGLAVSTRIGWRRSQSTFGPVEWFTIGISGSTLDAEFLVLPEKRERFRPSAFLKQWKVVSITPTDVVEPMYSLATGSGRFVIEGNILVAGEAVTQCRL